MISASLLCCTFFAIFGVSWGYEDLYTVPVCEDKGPDDVYLDFSGTGLNKLSKSSVFDSSIKCLNYQRNNILEIDANAFENVPDLFYLNLAENRIDWRYFIKTTTPNLETLILDGPYHEQDYYSRYDSYNENEGSLLSLPELRKLSLQYYGPSSRYPHVWLSILDVPALTHLYLSGNGLTTIANLAKMPNLTHVNLDGNVMQYISGSFFKNLEYLSMNRNNIKNVCGTFCKSESMTTHGMHKLKYLSLADNKIENIGSDAFVDLENLLILKLTENKIQNFPQHAFDNMTKLKNLTLDKNYLARVPDICPLQELEILSLNENQIIDIDETNFCNLTKLAMVYLRKNSMTTIAEKTFANLPALSILDLSSNSIYILPQNWIMPNNRLNILHLDGNKFTDIAAMSLESLDALSTLTIFNNPIDEISIKSLLELPQNITLKLSLHSQTSMDPSYEHR